MTDEEGKSCFELVVNYRKDAGVAPYRLELPIDVITRSYDEFIQGRKVKSLIKHFFLFSYWPTFKDK